MLYSIGYATKPLAVFIDQLLHYGIDSVADVRSVPYSKVFHDYHQESLQLALPKAGIRYVYLGKELGPRSQESAHYDECGQVQFDRLVKSSLFQRGVARLAKGMGKGHCIALMCAEKDPANCHRSLLIGHYLKRERDTLMQHINFDGSLETQQALELRLVEIQKLTADLLTETDELEAIAYQRHLKQTSYRRAE